MTIEEMKQTIKAGRADSEKITTALLEDPTLALELVRYNGLYLEYLPEAFRNDESIVLEAVEMNGFAIQFASNDRIAAWKIALAAALQNRKALPLIPAILRDNRVFLCIVNLVWSTPPNAWEHLLYEYQSFIRLGAYRGAYKISSRENNHGGKLFIVPYNTVEIGDLSAVFWSFLSADRWTKLLEFNPEKAFGGFLLMKARECFEIKDNATESGLLSTAPPFALSIDSPSGIHAMTDTDLEIEPQYVPGSDERQLRQTDDTIENEGKDANIQTFETNNGLDEVKYRISHCLEQLPFLRRCLLIGKTSGLSYADLLGLFPEAKSTTNIGVIIHRAKADMRDCLAAHIGR